MTQPIEKLADELWESCCSYYGPGHGGFTDTHEQWCKKQFLAFADDVAAAQREQDRAELLRVREALERIAKRPDLPNPERDADWKNCQKWSSANAKEALKCLEGILNGAP